MLLIRRLAAPSIVGLLVAVVPSVARADKKECSEAHVEAQKSMKAGTLRKARDHLKVCSRDECIAPIRKDCVAWLDEVNASIPSVVIDAKGPDGKETFDVKVSVGGEVVAEKLDVKAIELDPGTFTFRFERAGSAPLQQEVILRQGQKNKTISVSFATANPATSSDTAPTSSAKAPAKDDPRSQRHSIVPWAIGGAGIVLAGVGGAFWYAAESSRGDLVDSNCEPNCDQGTVDEIKTQRLVGDIFVGVGIAALTTAVVWIVLESQGSSSKPSATWTAVMQRGLTF